MNNIKNIHIQPEYLTNGDFSPDEFYSKCFKNSRFYRRASGFFSTSIYNLFKIEIYEFIKNGGIIEIVCSQSLDEKDIETIESGYNMKELISKNFKEELYSFLENNEIDEEINFAATLIKFNKLNIKIVFYENGYGIFHEKVGYFKDKNDNFVSFSGSMNESKTGISNKGNFERIKTFKSWDDMRSQDAYRDKKFVDDIWNNKIEGLNTIEFPEVPKKMFIKRAQEDIDISNFPKLNNKKLSKINSKKRKIDNLLDYQSQAVENWNKNNCKGILKHATGSGKTITSIFIINEHIKQGNPAIVIVPSRLLLFQWYDELKNEIPESVILRCGAGFSKWRNDQSIKISLHKKNVGLGIIILSVLDTASIEKFQNQLHNFEDILLVIDEVHTAGSLNARSIFKFNFKKRLGLSATPNRYSDPEGTEIIFNYFDKIIEPIIDIKFAIDKKRLVNYEYFPEFVLLNETEENDWLDLTQKISKYISKEENLIDLSDPILKYLLISRSRIAKKANNKIKYAEKIVKSFYKDDGKYWLIYCEDEDQLQKINKLLINMNIYPFIYTTKLAGDPKSELKAFLNIGGIMLSIRCLDEGIDIPKISHAIILSSSQNPRQFIQRRGRVLRVSENKNKAIIYDCLVKPNNVAYIEKFNTLVVSEIKRSIEFSKDALNKRFALSYLRSGLIKLGIDPDNNLNLDEEDE